MKNFLVAALLCLTFNISVAGSPFANLPGWVEESMKTVQAHAKNMLPPVLESGMLPRSTQQGLRPADDWTAGFYPGMLWYLYAYTRDSYWEQQARKATALLDGQQHRTADHDIGFLVQCSFGNGWAMTGDPKYRKTIIQAAHTLANMYNPQTRTIQSWPANEEYDWKCPVIIDNMMNLELLLSAYKLTGINKFEFIAQNHANRTIECHFREDFSCPHVVDYDPCTGVFRKPDWRNGDSDPHTSVWSRGQSWGLYGYTMMYRRTKQEKYLKQAEKIADFILSHPNMPPDMIPYWDLSAPHKSKMRDSSAAALIASALMDLTTFSQNGERYFEAGEKILRSLSSEKYLSKPGTNNNFILKHATGNFLRNKELDGGLSYADYYFTEGLLRYIKRINAAR